MIRLIISPPWWCDKRQTPGGRCAFFHDCIQTKDIRRRNVTETNRYLGKKCLNIYMKYRLAERDSAISTSAGRVFYHFMLRAPAAYWCSRIDRRLRKRIALGLCSREIDAPLFILYKRVKDSAAAGSPLRYSAGSSVFIVWQQLGFLSLLLSLSLLVYTLHMFMDSIICACATLPSIRLFKLHSPWFSFLSAGFAAWTRIKCKFRAAAGARLPRDCPAAVRATRSRACSTGSSE